METYGKILAIAGPSFFVLVMLEKLYGWYVKKQDFKLMDMVSSLSSAYTNTVKDVLGLSVSIISYKWLYEHWAVFHPESTILLGFIAFICLDFSGYVGHAINHKVNFFWNQHLIHHSSEEFNLACALRQSISNIVNFFTIFLLPAALLGVPPLIISIIAPIHLFAQFWYHTVYIGKLGFLEKIIVTPSHHRVHHAINPEYLDKNHGQIFIFWDKLFGTFQAELESVQPIYGITRPVQTWNPIKINFQHFWLLLQDAWRTKNWQDKWRIWLKPTGWRPADVAEKYPVYKIDEPYSYQKYEPSISKITQIWTFIQYTITFLMLMHFYTHITEIGIPNVFVLGGFMFLMVYAYTELMDGNRYAFWWELAKNLVGLGILYRFGSWFGLSNSWNIVLGIYFLGANLVVYGLLKKKLSDI